MIESIWEFLWLARDPDGITLTEAQRRRLETLEQLLANPLLEVREYWRIAVRGPCEFERPNELSVGQMVDISAGGLRISTWRPLDPFTYTTVRFADLVSRHRYELPCVVVWARGGEEPGMGLRFVGPPARDRIPSSSSLGRLSFGVRALAPEPSEPGIEYEDTGLFSADDLG